MLKKLVILLLVTFGMSASLNAATLTFDPLNSTVVTGITGVVVDGVTYEAEFKTGTYESIGFSLNTNAVQLRNELQLAFWYYYLYKGSTNDYKVDFTINGCSRTDRCLITTPDNNGVSGDPNRYLAQYLAITAGSATTFSGYGSYTSIFGEFLLSRTSVLADWKVSPSAVPIPAAAFMFAPALLGFLGLRRKMRA